MRKKLISSSVILAAGLLMGGTCNVHAQNVRNSYQNLIPKTLSTELDKDNPVSIKSYVLDEEADSFVYSSQSDYKYDESGNVISERRSFPNAEFPSFYEMLMKYNNDNIVIESIVNDYTAGFESLLYAEKQEYEYDKIVKDYVTNKKAYNLNIDSPDELDAWRLIYDQSAFSIINRDEQDRVTSEEFYRYNNPDAWYMKAVYTYGEGNSPFMITLYSNEKDENGSYEILNELSDIEWFYCYNQMIDIDIFDNNYNIYGHRSAFNCERYKPLKFTKKTWGHDGTCYTNHFDMTYDDQGRITSYKRSYNTGRLGMQYTEYVYTDEYGSHEVKRYNGSDNNNDGTISDDELDFSQRDVKVFNSDGLVISKKSVIQINHVSVTPILDEYGYTYDDKGRIAEVSVDSYDQYADKTTKTKHVYEYDDTATGIASVNKADVDMRVAGNVVTFGSNLDGSYVVCNAEGKMVMSGCASDGWVSLESLPSGFYIVSVDGAAVKVLR